MKSWLIVLFFSAIKIVMACWTSLAHSAALDLKNVSADAAWVAHLDLDAGRSSKVMQQFHEECIKPCAGLRLALIKARMNMGVEKADDLHDITTYGLSFRPHRGVMIVRAKVNAKLALAKAERSHDYEMQKYGEHKIHTWEMRHGRRALSDVAASLYKPDVLVFASSVDLLRSALDVLDGKSKNLSEEKSPLAEKVPEGTIVLARAANINKAARFKDCPILKQIERFDYVKGQQGDKWFGNMTVTADSPATANNLKEVLEGFHSFMALYFLGKEPIVNMLGNVKTAVEGNAVKVSFEESADKVAEQMPAVCKMIQEHIMKHHRQLYREQERDRFRDRIRARDRDRDDDDDRDRARGRDRDRDDNRDRRGDRDKNDDDQ